MFDVRMNCQERVALRELELTIEPPPMVRYVLGEIEFNPRDGVYQADLKTTQIGQLRAYVRDHANGDGRLRLLYDKLESIYRQVEPLYRPGRNA